MSNYIKLFSSSNSYQQHFNNAVKNLNLVKLEERTRNTRISFTTTYRQPISYFADVNKKYWVQ